MSIVLKRIVIAGFVLFSIAGFAQKKTKGVAEKRLATRGKTELGVAKSLLWKISGNGLKEASYLYGTIHITCDATLDQVTKDALDKTKQLYLELDMDDPSLQTAMLSGMMMTGGKKMSEFISAEDFKILDEYMVEKTGISATLMNTMKPFVITTLFFPTLIDCKTQSVEESLMAITKDQNEPIYGLETAADQFAAFDSVPYEEQMEELMKSVKDKFASDKVEMTKMYELYKNKDILALFEMTKESDSKMSNNQEEMLDNRNSNWIAAIESASKDKPTFFGVGAAHLAGEKGVISLLRKKGYKLEAMQ